MNGIFCVNKTLEERLAATKRMIMVMLVFMSVAVGIVLYEVITMAVGNRTEFTNFGQICATLGCLTCTLSLNLKRKKEFEAELEEKCEG